MSTARRIFERTWLGLDLNSLHTVAGPVDSSRADKCAAALVVASGSAGSAVVKAQRSADGGVTWSDMPSAVSLSVGGTLTFDLDAAPLVRFAVTTAAGAAATFNLSVTLSATEY